MVRVDVGGRVDLQTVVVLASILKQTVHGVQNLMREQEEPFPKNTTRGQTTIKWTWSYWLSGRFCEARVVESYKKMQLYRIQLKLPGHTSVVQAFLSREDDPQSPPQILRVKAHDL